MKEAKMENEKQAEVYESKEVRFITRQQMSRLIFILVVQALLLLCIFIVLINPPWYISTGKFRNVKSDEERVQLIKALPRVTSVQLTFKQFQLVA